MNFKTVHDEDFIINPEHNLISYQTKLTNELDSYGGDLNTDMINKITLWKVNRYPEITDETIYLINKIDRNDNHVDEVLTLQVITALLTTKGIQLPLASTILRFRNPNVFQIIDQRVYRILYGKALKLSTYNSTKNVKLQFELYMQYLTNLRQTSERLQIPFEIADRVLYNADKTYNDTHNLQNYGSKSQ